MTLAERWRAQAAILRLRGADPQAATLESCAADLETYERERELEAITLTQAAAESGYSYSALQKMVGQGIIPNAGKPHSPRLRRGDLPKKPGALRGDLADRILTARTP